ncbi:MAG: hypothetical protein HXL10_01945 [Candidatus Nanosynbacter sp.]|nr:hypothetical protein [Candidatus Nanosynbacter sp.]
MNKDTFYIEPEDDITDIINHIKASKQKIIALVPPKKLNVLRSSINLKLIARTAKIHDKAIVVVTTDPTLMKMAALSSLPFAKNLSSRPTLPSEFNEADLEYPVKAKKSGLNEEIEINEKAASSGSVSRVRTANEDAANRANTTSNLTKNSTMNLDSEEVAKNSEDEESDNQPKKILTLDSLKNRIIIGVVAAVLLIGSFVWAFILAPAAKISVKIKTIAENFSENVSFVTDAKQAVSKDGKFFLETASLEKNSEVEFEATGEKNVGDKATGELRLIATFDMSTTTATASRPDVATVPQGSAFAYRNLNFLTDQEVKISWDGSISNCDAGRHNGKCQVAKTVKATAIEGGAKYNIEAVSSGWQSSVAGVEGYANSAFKGGTDKIQKIVIASDISKAKEKLTEADGAKDELFEKVPSDDIKIEDSYKKVTADPTSSPAVDQPTENGKAKLTAKTTYSVNYVDKAAIEEYVKSVVSTRLGDDQKIYETGNIFIEKFQNNNNSVTAKIKATLKTGPEVTEQSVLEKSLGKKVGEVTTLIKSINGVSDVEVNTSFPWVRQIPNDANKVSIKIMVEN